MTKAFGLLLFFNALLLYVHYQDASNVSASKAGKITYNQEIEIINRHDEFVVRHHFTNLPQNRLEIVWPADSEKRTCHLDEANTCSRLDERVTAFIEGEETRQSISYVIPKSGSMEDSRLFQSVFATLYKANANATVIHLTDEMNAGGMWVTGLQEAGKKRMNLIDYFLFTGEGSVTDLYWQKQSYPIVYLNDNLSVFSSSDSDWTKEIEEVDKALNELGVPHTQIILNDTDNSISSNRFIITAQTEMQNALYQFVINYLHQIYEISSEDKFAAEITASLILNEEIGSDTSRIALKVLKSHLATNERERLKEKLHSMKGQILSAHILDQLFEEVTGNRTSFFTKNSQTDKHVYPLLLEIPHDIFVSGAEKLNEHAIIKDNQIYYPISEMMKTLGFEVYWNEKSLYIESAEKAYRFPLHDYFYVLNKKRYPIYSIPFERIGDEFYFEESALIRIFQFEIEKTANKIDIMPIGIISEEKN